MGNCVRGSAECPSGCSLPTNPDSKGLLTPKTSSSSTTRGSSSTFGLFSSGSNLSLDEIDGRGLDLPILRVFTYAELKQATRNFKPEMLIGEGGYGKVYKGWVEEKTLSPRKAGEGIVVAVKTLKPESMQGLEEWQSEVHFLGRLLHPNLVKLLGYSVDTELLLVYEFMQKGSLENHLFKRGDPLSWEIRMKIATCAAKGLAFLHISERQVIYRDFKASNILLDSSFNAKLSDFGLAKLGPIGDMTHVTTRVMGTFGYAAPEYLTTGHLYVKSDVYGYGVVLMEMLTGQRALDRKRPNGQHSLVVWAAPMLNDRKRLARIMDQRLEGRYPSRAAFGVAQLASKCVDADPNSRPSMNEVVDALEQIDALEQGRRPRDQSKSTESSQSGSDRSFRHRSRLRGSNSGGSDGGGGGGREGV